MRILSSANKHGVTDADIHHALDNTLRVFEGRDEELIFIGPARNGIVLEVGVVLDDDPRIIHAMPARAKYWP